MKTGITYDDVLLVPQYSDIISRTEVDLATEFGKGVELSLPIISSPMDTVTEHKMAIELALQGGIGIIHCNNSIEEQVEQVMKVKTFQNGFITSPILLGPNDSISEIYRIKQDYGFSGIPITENGEMNAKLLGMVSIGDVVSRMVEKYQTETKLLREFISM